MLHAFGSEPIYRAIYALLYPRYAEPGQPGGREGQGGGGSVAVFCRRSCDAIQAPAAGWDTIRRMSSEVTSRETCRQTDQLSAAGGGGVLLRTRLPPYSRERRTGTSRGSLLVPTVGCWCPLCNRKTHLSLWQWLGELTSPSSVNT